MKRRTLLASLALICTPWLAQAQGTAFPSKPLRVIVPFSAGSGSDTGARVYGEMLSKMVGQPVLVENRPGASGQIAIQTVRQAPADGYTILLASNSPLTVNPVVMKNLPYDPVKDIRPLVGLGKGAAAFVVKGDSPHRSMADLVASARSPRRALNAGNYSAGYQLINTWLGTAAGIEMTHVAYKGGAQMVNDVMSGDLDFGVIDFGGVQALMKEGRVRVLALTADRRHPSFPDIPTMKESGFPDFETWVWTGFYVRSDTPEPIVQRLADLWQQVLESEPAKAYQATQTSQVLHLKLDEMRRFQLAEYERFRRVAEAAGVKPQ